MGDGPSMEPAPPSYLECPESASDLPERRPRDTVRTPAASAPLAAAALSLDDPVAEA